MRIVHVVTLLTPDGAFGGPWRVALNQVAELRTRGHDATILSGWRGGGPVPTQVDGVPVTLQRVSQVAPGMGFSGLFSPGVLRWLREEAGSIDLLHVHSGRDLITISALAAAAKLRIPYVVQTHGMVGLDTRFRARLIDAFAVRPLIGRAKHHLLLTDVEAQSLPTILRGSFKPVRINNGVPLPKGMRSEASHPEVLYCARLHPRKRPSAFVSMAGILRSKGVGAKYAVVGPDEGSLKGVLDQVRALDLADVLSYEGALPYEDVLQRMRRATVYVLPSVDEPFPMTLLEAMSLGVPSVCTDSCGLAPLLRESGAALVTDGSPEMLAEAVGRLLATPDLRADIGERARAAVEEHFSVRLMVDTLEKAYDSAVGT